MSLSVSDEGWLGSKSLSALTRITMNDHPPETKPRWYHPTPDKFLVALLPILGLLFLSEQFRWFAFNEHKNWTVLIALAVICVAVVLLLLWFGVSLVFRRPFQYSIRSLLALVAVVAVACSWFTVKMQQARRQREVVEALQEMGGRFFVPLYDYEIDADGNVTGTLEFPGPSWLQNLLGVDFLSDVLSIDIGDDGTDTSLVHLKELTNLEQLVVQNRQVTDAGLVNLRGLTSLRNLWLSGAEVTDVGLMHLKGLTNLQFLTLASTQVSDSGLVHLRGLRSLQHLHLSNTQVSDGGLVHLKGLRNLQYLSLSNTQVTDAGVKELQQALPNCVIMHSYPRDEMLRGGR